MQQFSQRHAGRGLVGRLGHRAAEQWLGKFKFARVGRLQPEHGQRKHIAVVFADQAVE